MGAGVPAAVVGVSLCVTAHNFEEALEADEFLQLTERLRPRFLTLSRRRFLVLLVLITLPLWTLAALAARGEAPGRLRGVLVCIQAGFGANAIAPHVYLSLRLRRYTPGVATAALLNLPFSLYLLYWTRATRTYSLEQRLTVPLQSTIVAIHFNKLPLVTTPMSLPSPEGFIGTGRNGAQTQSPTGRSDVKRTMVRYKVKPEQAAHNEELVRRVYEELQRTAPEGLRYATFASEDGVSFVHVASIETGDGSSPLADVAAFRTFQENIGARCDEPPVAIDLREIGSYGFWGVGTGT